MNKWLLSWAVTTSIVLYCAIMYIIMVHGDARRETARADACEKQAKDDEHERTVETYRIECREVANAAAALAARWPDASAATRDMAWTVSRESCLERKIAEGL